MLLLTFGYVTGVMLSVSLPKITLSVGTPLEKVNIVYILPTHVHLSQSRKCIATMHSGNNSWGSSNVFLVP